MMSGLTSTRKVSREQLTQNYRRGAVNYLFMYLYVLRCGRPPEGWEIGLARSLLISVLFFSKSQRTRTSDGFTTWCSMLTG